MKKTDLKSKLRLSSLQTVFVILLLVISILFLWIGSRNTNQASDSSVAGLSFQGEYRIGDGIWHPIVEGEHIPASNGDVTLRGYFLMHNPTTNEPLAPLPADCWVYLYFNHLYGTVYTASGNSISFDAENELFGEDACASMWSSYYIEPSETDVQGEPIYMTFVLHNPHQYGNERAVDEFLENMSLAPGILLEEIMLEKGESGRNVGHFIIISALIILGIAAFSTVIHIKNSREMWLIGLMSLFAGGYFIFNAFGVSLWNSPNILNTRILGLCMMFYMLVATVLITISLKKKPKRIALAAILLSSVVILTCILLSWFTSVKFYDTWLYWVIWESAIAVLFIICQLCCFRNASIIQKLLYTVGILMLSVFVLDVIATAFGWWQGGLLSKFVFLGVYIIAIVVVMRVIPIHINAAIRAKQLQAEQQALKLELQESRISIMLSQMQPHFIFNTLNTIYHLCEFDPEKAKTTISTFSEYLRNNIDTLGQSDMISFEKELSFVRTYLDIEKVRFDDELEISYHIDATNFKLPVLTVQPIVENAVKHGTSKKSGISTLTISTAEERDCYTIVIADTGVGFDMTQTRTQDDGHTHIGINSVRQRLENLCSGTLTIESAVGVGTTATIRIPKKEVQ